MAEYPRNTGAGSTGTGGTGGTGYNEYSGGSPHEPRSSAALWIVGIVVVVGALAIWIARNTVDDTDRMQYGPGMDQTATDRDLDRSVNGSPVFERSDDQDVHGLNDEHYGSDDAGDRDLRNSTTGAQQGTGTIEGRTTTDGRSEPMGSDRSSSGTSDIRTGTDHNTGTVTNPTTGNASEGADAQGGK